MKTAKDNKGFSLMEVLISMIIFSITLFGVLPLVITSMGVTSGTSFRSKAQMAAAEKLDELKSLSAVEVETLVGDDIKNWNKRYVDSDTVSVGSMTLNRDWVIQEAVLQGTNAPSYIMFVTVSYKLGNEDEPVIRTVSTVWGH
ncbi:MAG: prepilin-type N-terminal cleavage/methylation domain-containing protein [Thermodesulfobacteriota bacterium]